jgi:predicted extracellular nuclease
MGAASASPGVVINEIHADPAAGLAGDANGDGTRDATQDEFVELVNDGVAALDISGWTLADGFGVRHTFPAGTTLSATCSIVVFGGDSPTGAFGNGVVQTASSGALGLNNSGDTVTLNDGTSDVATYTYGSEGGNNQSLTRDPDVTGSDPLVEHSGATGSGGALWSPGTLIDGVGYAGCPAPPLGLTGSATPSVLAGGEATLLTATVTPGTDPASTGIAVEGDLGAIGGAATQQFFDDGTNGDVTAGDDVFSFATTIGGATPAGAASVPVTASDDQGRTGTASIDLTIVAVLTIMEIQGSGQFSPFVGDIAQTSGVVIAISANGRDGWIQDPLGDGDPATSDGIFIDDFDAFVPTPPAVGDLITVRGQVEELQFGTALPLTRIDDTQLISIDSSGNPLPTPIQLTDQPDFSVEEAIEILEPVEGMRVSVSNGFAVSATSRFGEFALLTSKDSKKGSGYEPSISQILVRALGQDPNIVDYNPERILVDDATLDDAIQVQPGDKIKSIVGVMDYTFSNYKIQPTDYDVVTSPLPNDPVSKRNGPTGDTTITTFNVENLFDLEFNTPSVIDSLGQVAFNAPWGPPSTENNTLLRKPTICSGDTDPTDPFDPDVEWVGTGNNNFDDLGMHSVTCGNATGLLISEYIEGSSFNKALEIYNGTGAAVNLKDENVNVQIFFNDNTSAGQTISLSGTLGDGDVYVLAHPDADQDILDVTDQLSSGVQFNGNDTVTLNVGGKDDASSTPTPAELATQLAKLALAIEDELRLPEIMVLQEVENTGIAQALGDLVNASVGTDYVAVSFETSDGRGIEVAFLYDDDRVDLLDAFQLSGPDVEAAFGPSSASPGREPLYGLFEIGKNEVHIVGNHFKSKGGDDPIFGVNHPFNRPTEVQRKMQAQVVRDFVDGLLGSDPAALVMVTGDLNDFAFGEPNEGTNDPVAILEGVGGGAPFTNLINMEKEQERWTFIFDGNSQVLDHMLLNDALLAELVGTDILHFNAAIPAAAGNDPTTTLRASDHEAVEGRFRLEK